jgi:hypothetical protein
VIHRRAAATSFFLAFLLTAGACSEGSKTTVASAEPKRVTSSSTSSPSSSSSSSTTTTTSAPRPGTTARRAAPSPPPPTPATATPAALALPADAVIVGPAPTDPAELARLVEALVAAETALRSPSIPDGELAGLARIQQAAYRSISARPEVLPRVLERVPEGLRPAVEANVTAGAELRALAGKPRTELPPWRIIPAPPAEELKAHYQEAEARYGVPWAYLAAVHLVESRMGRIRGTSTAGAQGPMQFLPETWAAYGEGGDINNPRDAILAAARYLKRNGAPGDMAKALWNYNHSNRYVRAVTLYAGQIEADHRAYLGYYHWQVFYITVLGDVLLAEGYGA